MRRKTSTGLALLLAIAAGCGGETIDPGPDAGTDAGTLAEDASIDGGTEPIDAAIDGGTPDPLDAAVGAA
ncbi:MAG: hypothetical protein M3Y87_32770, partial [Myxococcota bacterium]|nr:hypothetical protein [Myxococcota bacterium]